jgi:type II secretory pathway component GspD/PulD (secretin)
MNNDAIKARRMGHVQMLVGITLALMLIATNAGAQTTPSDQKPESKSVPDSYQTIYVTNLTQQRDANDIVTDLRNMLPRARLYYVQSQGALSIRATPEDMLLAQKMLSDLDRDRKAYRVTYTITETDNGKKTGTQHVTLVVLSGEKTDMKQGSRVPIVTGSYDTSTANAQAETQVQYMDVGLNIEASLDRDRLRTKVEQTSVAEEKSGMGAQDPIVHQTVLDGMSTLSQGKPVVLGSLDIPGSTRHQEIEVASELVR